MLIIREAYKVKGFKKFKLITMYKMKGYFRNSRNEGNIFVKIYSDVIRSHSIFFRKYVFR